MSLAHQVLEDARVAALLQPMRPGRQREAVARQATVSAQLRGLHHIAVPGAPATVSLLQLELGNLPVRALRANWAEVLTQSISAHRGSLACTASVMQQRSTTKAPDSSGVSSCSKRVSCPKVRAARKRASKSPVNPSSLLRQSANALTRLLSCEGTLPPAPPAPSYQGPRARVDSWFHLNLFIEGNATFNHQVTREGATHPFR